VVITVYVKKEVMGTKEIEVEMEREGGSAKRQTKGVINKNV
jgi:hypothetical protein